MLINLREYHRPTLPGDQGLARALELLSRREIRTVPLAGGDTLVGSADPAVEAVVDLQGLGLGNIVDAGGPGGRLRIGAMATRSAVAGHEALRTRWSGMVAEGARRWGGSVQRNRATVGGAVATAAPNDPLVVALLACDALVELYTQTGRRVVPLADFLPQRAALLAAPGLITQVMLSDGDRCGALATVARTPSDAPIVVAAAAMASEGGTCTRARLALGGVGPIPMRLPAVEALLEGQPLTEELICQVAARVCEQVQPVDDFRASAGYRKAMAGVLAERAVRQAWRECNAATQLHPQ